MKKFSQNIIYKAFRYPALIFVANHLVGKYTEFYERNPSVDMPMHVLGGFVIAHTGVILLSHVTEKKQIKVFSVYLSGVLIVGWVALFAIFWEFYEWIMDNFFLTNTQPSLDDTILDLFLGLVGGMLYFLIYKFRNKDK